MSETYQFVHPNCRIQLAEPGEPVGADRLPAKEFGLIIGDPDDAALVVQGPREEIRHFLRRALTTLGTLPSTSTDNNE
ncbi:hypothetical protein [Amycolatopsis anabasis]|uniref:hypothetical protein n=1 Tax=Amycolatopsis anabasis TaxID=1840409 RepID=UPI00131BAFA5|nr:hypothetical protein [Amycolatopsis anabasis]